MKKVGHTPPPAPRGINLRALLYVEDNDDNWRVAQLRLASKFELVRASTDKEACTQLRDHGARFVAILMDIELQGSLLNGIDLARIARGKATERPLPDFAGGIAPIDAPIIFMTAYGDVYSEAALVAAGGDRVLTKPIDFKVLNMALMNLYVNRSVASS